VDTLGLILAVVVHPANVQGYGGAVLVLGLLGRTKERFRRLKEIIADSAYGRNDLPECVKDAFGWVLRTVLRPVSKLPPPSFSVWPRVRSVAGLRFVLHLARSSFGCRSQVRFAPCEEFVRSPVSGSFCTLRGVRSVAGLRFVLHRDLPWLLHVACKTTSPVYPNRRRVRFSTSP
jgi:hypothetical protein